MQRFIHESKKPDAEKKSCSDCFFLRGAVTLWCLNEEARDYRGTRIPGVYNCHFWEPGLTPEDLPEIPWYLRMLGYSHRCNWNNIYV